MTRRSLRYYGAVLMLTLAALALSPAIARGASAQSPSSDAKVNLNTAGLDELVTLPGIGKAYAERILEYREKNGPFKKVEEILNVRGIGEKTFERIKDRLTLGKN
jgi:comEA protein